MLDLPPYGGDMQEDFPVVIYRSMLQDLTNLCGVQYDVRDAAKIASRFRHEGDAFLRIVLPTLATGLEKALERGRVDACDFPYFSKKGSSKCPRFLGVFFALIFDENGLVLDSCEPSAVFAIRQIANFFKKPKENCDDAKKQKSLDQFVSTEAELHGQTIAQDDLENFKEVSRVLWSNLFSSISYGDLIPAHGPGATAEKISGNAKFTHLKWHERLEAYFPYYHNGLPSENWVGHEEDRAVSIPPWDEQPVRVIAVPKTAVKSRIIAIEPVCMQYAQQAVFRFLKRKIEHDSIVGGHINFSDQSINAALAIESSRNKEYATIDLSDASDRVTLSGVEVMLADCPDLLNVLDVCRSKRADVNGEVITLNKFAAMGSATCFPIEAMYFYTLCVVAGLKVSGLKPSFRNISNVSKHIYVYGDDIIVPVRHAQETCLTLQRNTCKVNWNKTFWRGSFRESCGTDAYNGYDVTPVYLRQTVPNKPYDANWQSICETANQLFKKGLWLTATTIDKIVEKGIGRKLPVTGDAVGFLHRSSFCISEPHNQPNGVGVRYRKNLCRYEIFAPVVCQKHKSDKLNGGGALMKFFLRSISSKELGLEALSIDEQHLTRTVRVGRATIKCRWCPAY